MDFRAAFPQGHQSVFYGLQISTLQGKPPFVSSGLLCACVCTRVWIRLQELAHAIVGAGKSKDCETAYWLQFGGRIPSSPGNLSFGS